MPRCLFCLQEKETLTDEHVFPAALGGVLVVKDSVCAECNSGFSKFEQSLASELTPFRLLLQIPDRYGKVPQVPATVKTADKEYEGRVKGDGSVQLKRIVTEVTGTDGRREFLHQFLTNRQREKLHKEASEKGYQIIESGPGEPRQGEVHVWGDLKFIGSPEGLRTASKIAYVGLAERAGPKLAMSDAFDEVRAYIREGTGKPPSRLFVHERFSKAVQTGPHQHLLIIAARHDKGCVDAIVRLFGGLNYFVKLSGHYGGADFFAHARIRRSQRERPTASCSPTSMRRCCKPKTLRLAAILCGTTCPHQVSTFASSSTMRSMPKSSASVRSGPQEQRLLLSSEENGVMCRRVFANFVAKKRISRIAT